jgi:exo-beta-1,3-glucanase (GH17 family)
MQKGKILHSIAFVLITLVLFFLIFTLFTASSSKMQPENNQLISSSQDINKLYGIDFSPYMDGQNPEYGSQVDKNQIIERMKIIAPYTFWIRTYGTTGGLEHAGSVAHEMGLKTAIGAWLSGDKESNDKQINELINESKAGYVDLAIIGSETLLRGDLSEDQLINYIKRVKQELPNVNVTTAEEYHKLINHPKIMAECDVIMYNSYPYWEGVSINNAIKMKEDHHKNLVKLAGDKQVIVSETGWPSSGNAIGNAVPSSENASMYFNNFVSWARKNNVQYFYFEAFDETWKATNEGPQGAHWGIWDKNGNMKPGFEAVFQRKEPESRVMLPYLCNLKV